MPEAKGGTIRNHLLEMFSAGARTIMRSQIQYLRKVNIRLCLVFFLSGLIGEVIFFFMRYSMEALGMPVPEYLLWHLILPSGINFVLYLTAVLLVKHFEGDERTQNLVPVLILVLQTAVLGTFHHSYSILMILFLFPVFLSTVFGDRELCTATVLMSLMGETILLLVRWYLNMRIGNEDKMFLPEAVLAYAILVAGGVTAVRMVDRFLGIRDAEAEEREREKAVNMNMQMVTTLVNTIEAKDPYTNGHSNRVAMYAREIAVRAGKNADYLQRLYYMSILHDIGKIGIPDRILKKTGELDPEETSIIQTHPIVGAEILSDITQMPGIEIGARSHHEHYDGSGYPDGLAGDRIPEEARIIAVADAYDAMTSERSYRSAFSQEETRKEMEDGRGTQFDPRFLDIMLDMIDKDEYFAMHGTDTDDLLGIVQLRALLGREEERTGALQTNSSGFEEIYHFLRRYARRNSCEVQLVLITMEMVNAHAAQTLDQPQTHEKWMGHLADVVKKSVRQTDVECQLGLSQYMVILTDTSRVNADIALMRIRRSWEELEENPGYRLSFEVQDIIGDGVDAL